MRKLVLIATTLLLLSGCGNTDVVKSDTQTPTDTTTTATQSDVGEIVTVELEEPKVYDETFDKGEAFSDGNISISVVDFSHTSDDCYVTLDITNNSKRDYTISEIGYAVNNICYVGDNAAYPYMDMVESYIDLGAEDTITRKFRIRDVVEFQPQIDNVKSAAFCFKYFDDNYDYCYAYFELRSNYYDGKADFIDRAITYEDDNIMIQYAGLDESTIGDIDYKWISFSAFGNADSWYEIELDSVTVNGTKIGFYDFWLVNGGYTFPQCKNMCDIAIDEKELFSADIDEIETVEINLTLVMGGTREVKTETITFDFTE